MVEVLVVRLRLEFDLISLNASFIPTLGPSLILSPVSFLEHFNLPLQCYDPVITLNYLQVLVYQIQAPSGPDPGCS